ncbi:hypothetical protein BIV60_25815 [Bacillus sp. MUM 116]|uniref:hypothetical protein n=1 Tax=Bacillus sp. MUM 116 TaxID=1678002 RepID=UPI0008F5B9CC|nr:hypothetical protein [Bacillus sp. MUM 116]OIK08628.1 hypothetical protein BIV60_25815 [Bacillus sp. MUM 116]
MQFDLLDNGIDSLKASGDILLDYYLDYEFERHQIKDAVFHFMHGVEIVSKYLLSQKNEELLFKKLIEYQEAKKKMEDNNLSSVFDANPEIRTIDVMTALKRLDSQTKVKIDGELYDSLDQIRLFRNQLTHYTVNLDDGEFVSLVTLIRRTFEQILTLFEKNIPQFKNRFKELAREEPVTEYDEYLDRLETLALMAYEDARLDYEADRDDILESQAMRDKD